MEVVNRLFWLNENPFKLDNYGGCDQTLTIYANNMGSESESTAKAGLPIELFIAIVVYFSLKGMLRFEMPGYKPSESM